MAELDRSAGDAIPGDCEVIQVHVAELKQLFNAIDPSPFRDRDLDPNAEAFILAWARGAPRGKQLALRVHIDHSSGIEDEAATLREAIREFFAYRATTTRQRLLQLLSVGRKSLVIGLVFLVGSVGLGGVVEDAVQGRLGVLLREGLLIGGWVAMWRPLEIFLYDWWPIRAEMILFRRLASMPVRVVQGAGVLREPTRMDDWAIPGVARRP